MKGNQVKATTRNRFFHRRIVGVRMTEGNEKGVVLILTLAIVLILAVLVMEFRYLATIELQSATSFGEEIKAAYLAKAGISYGINMLRHDDNDFDSLSEEWAKTAELPYQFSLGEGMVEFSIIDEDSKLLFDEKMKGEGGEERRMQADKLFDYLKVDTTVDKIKDNLPFLTSAELILATGPELKDYGTVNSSGLININTAKEAILKSLEIYTSLDGVAERVLEYREKDPFKTKAEIQTVLTDTYYQPIQGLITTESHFFSIVSQGTLGDNKKTCRAVVKRDKEGIKVLYWRMENQSE